MLITTRGMFSWSFLVFRHTKRGYVSAKFPTNSKNYMPDGFKDLVAILKPAIRKITLFGARKVLTKSNLLKLLSMFMLLVINSCVALTFFLKLNQKR